MIDFSDIDVEEIKQSDSLSDKEFVDFLIENDIYDKFIDNLHREISNDRLSIHHYYNRCWFSIDSFCDDIRIRYGRGTYVNYAFAWSNTDEGRDFWKEIYNLWERKSNSC